MSRAAGFVLLLLSLVIMAIAGLLTVIAEPLWDLWAYLDHTARCLRDPTYRIER